MKGFELTKSVIDHVSDGIIVIDTDRRIVMLNASASRIRHPETSELKVGNPLLDSVRMEWRNIVQSAVNTTFSTGKPSSFETDYSIDGKKVNYDIVFKPICDMNGEVTYVLIEMNDITLQKIYEDKNTRAANDIRNLIEYINAVIIGVDTGGYITEWNQAAFETTGFSADDTLRRHFSEVIEDVQSQVVLTNIIADAASGKTCSNFELPMRSKAAGHISLLINTTTRKNGNGDVIGILVIGQDVTELSAYRRSLEQKVQERTIALQIALDKQKELVEIKNRFVSIASHEFRSPISVIDVHANAIRQIVRSNNPEVQTRLDNISHQAAHMRSLLEDVLLIGKSDAGKIEANVSCVDLTSFLERLTNDVSDATQSTHHIITTFPPGPILIETDENLLRNIFVNLLTNAVKFSPGAGEVHLQMSVSVATVSISVQDHGIGIPAADLDRVFQPFNRAANAKTIKGTGLGLSIVKKAVDILQGQLSVDSQESKGTTFTVQLKMRNNL